MKKSLLLGAIVLALASPVRAENSDLVPIDQMRATAPIVQPRQRVAARGTQRAYRAQDGVHRPIRSATGFTQMGSASYYNTGRRTANGERPNWGALTAAHRTLPMGTRVRVTNVRNNRSIVVRINDRGPFIRGRSIDLTPAGARALGFIHQGHAPVRLAAIN